MNSDGTLNWLRNDTRSGLEVGSCSRAGITSNTMEDTCEKQTTKESFVNCCLFTRFTYLTTQSEHVIIRTKPNANSHLHISATCRFIFSHIHHRRYNASLHHLIQIIILQKKEQNNINTVTKHYSSCTR